MGPCMKFSKPTVSLENISKECRSVLIKPFKGIKSSVNLNKFIGVSIDNENCKSNVSFLYSTSNFLSSVFIDDFSNVILKNIMVKGDLVHKNVILLNNVQPYIDLTFQIHKNILTTYNMSINEKITQSCSFITKINNSHAGLEMNLNEKYDSAIFYRFEKKNTIFSTILKYDLWNISIFQNINEKIKLSNETIITDRSILSRLGLLITTHCTDLRIELNTLMKLLLSIDKRIFDNFSVSICTEMEKFGQFDIGLGINLEI
ncbi:hypothetical protein M153_4312000814 [Pseudoloma neurophilia]|uniref:Uncharacterized protein n=1 Tax=Pseudoloma neurophilia TaxID=146866 RepID=A0A0R0LSW4_9MICR|nr:hypothetical protein M153_4312000814 [Pseudoloma neurophilia]